MPGLPGGLGALGWCSTARCDDAPQLGGAAPTLLECGGGFANWAFRASPAEAFFQTSLFLLRFDHLTTGSWQDLFDRDILTQVASLSSVSVGKITFEIYASVMLHTS